MFVKNSWYVAADHREIGRTLMARTLLGETVVLYRKESGSPVALENRCSHRRAPLHKGKLVGDMLQCGYHGFKFDCSGACVEVPGQSRVPPDAGVRSYPVEERYKWVWVWMGDPDRADPALIPDFHWRDDPDWAATASYMLISCNHQLIIDNLLDLSHVAFVHEGTIGTDDSDAKLTFERGEDFMRITRRAADIPPPPIYVKQGFEGVMDQTKTIDFAPPGFVWIDIGSVETNADGRNAKSAHLNILNAITPESEATSHYFWASARDFEISNETVNGFMFKETEKAFLQDKDILEAQQECIETDPSAPIIDVTADAGALHARKIIDRMLAEQGGARTD
jgi:phenylpropionate dioxygenase-like ring-hydroxylating dioxygenase large terminal subunit